MAKKVVTRSRVKNTLHGQFKDFLDGENISEQITKKIEEHSIKKGLVKEVYHYLDTSLVELSNGKMVEAYHLHRTLGNIIDLFTPLGEQVISDTKKEPCIKPRFQLKCLVAEVGKEEYVLLGYYSPNMVGSFSPADNGHYLIKTMTDGYQAGLDIFADDIRIISHQGASFIEADVDGDTDIVYANSKNVYTKNEVYTKDKLYVKDQLYTKNDLYVKDQLYTKNEVKNYVQEGLDTKINTADVQGKVTSFTNKDRLTIERMMYHINNSSSNALFLKPVDSSLPDYTFCQNINVGIPFGDSVDLYLDGASLEDYVADNVVLKSITGSIVGEFTERGTDPAGWGVSLDSSSFGVGIHYLYAEAMFNDGSVRQSNILSLFVKDANNLYDYARWSCGEYDDINIITNYGNVKITEQFSTIGEKSIAYQQSNPANYGYFYFDSTTTLTSGNNYTVSFDCYSPDASFVLQVRQDGELSRVTIPKSSQIQEISLSFTANQSLKWRVQLFNDTSDSRIFIDNISCILEEDEDDNGGED